MMKKTAEISSEQMEKIKQAVEYHILGPPWTGWRQFFYALDPFKPEQFVRAPKLYEDVNMIFALFYFIGIILFTVYSFIALFSQKSIEINTMVSASLLQPIYLNITAACSGNYQCGNWTYHPTTGQYSLNQGVSIQQTWNTVPLSSPCYGSNNITHIPAKDQLSYSFLVTVCYSANPADGVSITVPYTTTITTISTPSLTITIEGNQNYYTNNMYATVEMDPGQFKTLFFSQTKYVNVDLTSNYQPYAADFFYNGHSAISNNGALLFFRLQQFAYQTEKTLAFTFLLTMGQIGGFASIYLAVVSMFRGVVIMWYKSVFVIKDKTFGTGLGVNALQLCFVTCCRCFGLVPRN
jgi:hypothetical protein